MTWLDPVLVAIGERLGVSETVLALLVAVLGVSRGPSRPVGSYINFPDHGGTAQELASDSFSAGSGILIGLASGTAGLTYIGSGSSGSLPIRGGARAVMTMSFRIVVPGGAVSQARVRRRRWPSAGRGGRGPRPGSR